MNPELSAAVAVIVTGLAKVAVQVAVTWFVGEAESRTDASLAVQFELINAPVTAGQAPPEN